MSKRFPTYVFLGMLVALVIIFESAIFYPTIHGWKPDATIHGWKPDATIHGWSQRKAGNDVICPSALALFENVTELEMAIADNVLFHQRGGNLRSIEKYLNSHMQVSSIRYCQ